MKGSYKKQNDWDSATQEIIYREGDEVEEMILICQGVVGVGYSYY